MVIHMCVCMCVFIRKDIFGKCHLYISLISKLAPAIINVVPSRYQRVMWWRAVLSRARAECHWAHSDSLLHSCNHDAPAANERVEGGRTGLLWLSWQGERGRWCCWALLLRDVVIGVCVCVCVCVCGVAGSCLFAVCVCSYVHVCF